MRVRLDALTILPFDLDDVDLVDLGAILRDKEPVKCRTCGKKYSSKRSLARHIDAIHREQFTCCDVQFASRSALKIHHNQTHYDEQDLVYCKLCRRNIRRGFIVFHLNRCHVDETAAERLKEMLKLVNEQNQKTYKCKMCEKEYDNYSSLKAHRYIHTGRFRCKICDKSLSSEHALRIHLRKHKIFVARAVEGDEKYVHCEKCDKHICRRRLNFHNQTVHSRMKASRPICDYCGKSFQSKAHIARHMNSHLGLQPFKCTICAKAYKQKSTLLLHVSRHHSDDFKERLFAVNESLTE